MYNQEKENATQCKMLKHSNLHKQNTLPNINIIPSKYNARQKHHDY